MKCLCYVCVSTCVFQACTVFHSACSWRGRLRRISSEWERTLFSLIAFLHRSGCVEPGSCRPFFSENAEQGERRPQRVCLYRQTSEKGILWPPADWDPQRTEPWLIVRSLEVWHDLNFGLNTSEARCVLSPSWSLPLSYRGFQTTDFIIFRLQTRSTVLSSFSLFHLIPFLRISSSLFSFFTSLFCFHFVLQKSCIESSSKPHLKCISKVAVFLTFSM